jgi:hypothetical protein
MTIKLTYERVRELFDYDDGHLIWKTLRHFGKIAGCLHKGKEKGYWVVQIDGRQYKAHCVIWLWHYGEYPNHRLDHRNRIKADNHIENLRLATFEDLSDEAANGQNRSINSNNKSGCTGVFWNEKEGKWQSQIQFKKKTIYLGRYDKKEVAIAIRKQAEVKYHRFNHSEEATC